MGRPRIPVKTDSYDGRKYTTIPVTNNGRTSYPKIHLRTKNDEVAQRRLIALDGVDDPEEARRRIGNVAIAFSVVVHRHIESIRRSKPRFTGYTK